MRGLEMQGQTQVLNYMAVSLIRQLVIQMTQNMLFKKDCD